ncbi:hypothetical protein DRQ53_09235 [bacterium]|nr:MAG: hypothetical protein DRQ53_09235 [bacterium]
MPWSKRTILFAFCSLSFFASATTHRVAADADDPQDWTTLTATRAVLDLEWVRGELVGAVDPGGLLFYDPAVGSLRPFTTDDGLGSNRSSCIAVGDDGEIWVGSADAGITRILPDGRTRLLTALPDQLVVRAIAIEGDNAYYGGPDGGGRIISGLPERTFTTQNGLPDDDVRDVVALDTRAWFATAQGIGEFDIQRNDMVSLNTGLADLDVRALAFAGGRLYAGTASGLHVLDESVPGSEQWQEVSPSIGTEIVDLAGRGDRLAVLATDRRIWWRDDPSDPWTSQQAGQSGNILFAITMAADSVVHVAGRRSDSAPIGKDITPLFVDLDGLASPYYRRIYGAQFFGLATDRAGGAWVGAFPVDAAITHWRADGSIIAYTDEETGDEINGFNNDGWLQNLKIDVLEASDGAIWVSSFQQGVTRFVPGPDGNPQASTYEHFLPINSPLDMERVFSMAEDPHGNIWFCAAGELVAGTFNAGIDILTDPANARDPNSWLHLRRGPTLIGGDGLNRISFEGNQVAWLTIRDLGIQRFVYGDGTGIDTSRFDDAPSWRTITALPEWQADNLGSARDVRAASDGKIWVATFGRGLFSFDYLDEQITSADRFSVESIGARLLSDNVTSVGIAGPDGVWVTTDLGLSRISEVDGQTSTSSFTDLQTLLDFDLGGVVSPRALRSLSGGIPVRLEISGAASLMYVATARGLTRVDLSGGGGGVGPDDGPTFALYPNPVRAGEELVVEGFEGEAEIEIYDLQGRLLRNTTATAGESIWRLETLSGEPVANGMYMVRVIQAGQSSVRLLAVER